MGFNSGFKGLILSYHLGLGTQIGIFRSNFVTKSCMLIFSSYQSQDQHFIIDMYMTLADSMRSLSLREEECDVIASATDMFIVYHVTLKEASR